MYRRDDVRRSGSFRAGEMVALRRAHPGIMQHGVATFLTDYGIDGLTLATAVEERGLDALFLTEHTHIPTSPGSARPGGTELPRSYSHTFDPFVALAAMAAATERITLGTA